VIIRKQDKKNEETRNKKKKAKSKKQKAKSKKQETRIAIKNLEQE